MKPSKPASGFLKAIAKDAATALGAGNGSADDPVHHGASVRLSVDGVLDADYAVPSTQWRYIRKAGSARGYRAKGRGPIRSIVVKPGKVLKVVAKGEGLAVDLASEPSAIELVVRFGTHRHCIRFADPTVFVPDRRLVSKNAVRPTACLP